MILLKMLEFQFKRMVKRKKFIYLFLFVFTVIALSYLESCFHYYGMDISIIPSSAMGWIGRTPNNSSTTGNLHIWAGFCTYLLLPISAVVFADFYLTDQKSGTYSTIITRSSSNIYHISGAVLCFFGAFIIVFIPLLLLYPVCFILFPTDATIYPFLNTRSFYDISRVHDNWVLFPTLFYSYPHVSNFIAIIYNSALAGVWALFSYALSHFFRISKVLLFVLPTILLIIQGYITGLTLDNTISFIQYINPTWISGDRYILAYGAYFFLPLLFSLFVISLRIKKRRFDEL